MARINQELLERLQGKLGLSQSRVYALIDQKVRTAHLPRRLAAIALAAERGISISRFASSEDLAEIRQAGYRTPSVSLAAIPTQANDEATSSSPPRRKKAKAARRGPTNTVFVVHGRDRRLRESMFAYLRAIGLQPLEWHKLISMTGQAAPYVGTILDTAFRKAAAVVVLLTADDEARLKPEFWSSGDIALEKSYTGQARPNVLFEAGLAFARNPNSTVLAQVGQVRPFSDIAGRHVVHMSDNVGSRQELAIKLKNAGCTIDLEGTDWHTAGDFSLNATSKRKTKRRRR